MYNPRQSAVWLRSLNGATAKPCGVSIYFSVLVLFHIVYARGCHAMPRGLHARFCNECLFFAFGAVQQIKLAFPSAFQCT